MRSFSASIFGYIYNKLSTAWLSKLSNEVSIFDELNQNACYMLYDTYSTAFVSEKSFLKVFDPKVSDPKVWIPNGFLTQLTFGIYIGHKSTVILNLI